MNTKTKIISALLCMAVLFGSLSLTSCSAIGIDSGFITSNGEEINFFQAAYRSDKTIFDIEDVTLTFYYGGDYDNDIEDIRENIYNIPSFDIYFTDEYGNEILVKTVEENFVSDKYNLDVIYGNWYRTEFIFNHSESITIPKEMFTEESGVIYFSIKGTNILEPNPTYGWIAGEAIFYKKICCDKIFLSGKPFR